MASLIASESVASLSSKQKQLGTGSAAVRVIITAEMKRDQAIVLPAAVADAAAAGRVGRRDPEESPMSS